MNIAEWLENGAIFGLNESEVLVAFGGSHLSSEPNKQGYSFYSPDFYLESEKPWVLFNSVEKVNKQLLIKALSDFPIKPNLKIVNWTLPDKTLFSENFLKIKEQFKQSELEKLVPVIFETSADSLDKNIKINYISHLLSIGPEQTVYGLWGAEGGILGLSPEVLFEYDQSKLTLNSMALAGTHKLTEEKNSLLNNKKELLEHNFVLNDLSQTLNLIGKVSKSDTYEWKLSSLKHLRTDISVNLQKPIDIEEMIAKMHPTPALGVYPKSYDWKKIKNFETEVQRQKYGAPFGVKFDNGSFNSIVAIRNIQWNKTSSLLGSGCGIVKESNLESEWNELILKRNSVKKYLGVVK